MKKYQIIYADPPWNYNDKALAGNRGACCKYNVMDIEQIKRLPIIFDVIKSWGFIYKTVAFTWIKKNKKSDSLFWGMGRWIQRGYDYGIYNRKRDALKEELNA